MTLTTLPYTIGAAYLGVVASAILFGVANLQTFICFRSYPEDSLFVKLSVSLLWILDALNVSLSVHAVYSYLVYDFGKLAALATIVWSIRLQVVVNVIVICTVQTLYAIRVWKFVSTSQRVIPWLVGIAVVIGYAIGITLVIQTYQLPSFLELDTMAWVIYASFAGSTAIDFTIAITMCFFLNQGRANEQLSARTESTISALILYVLGSGLLTSACSMTALITYATMPENWVFLGIQFLLTNLYVNSYLAMLNARQGLRERSNRLSSNFTLPRMLSTSSDGSSGKRMMGFAQGSLSSRDTTINDDDGSVYYWAPEFPRNG